MKIRLLLALAGLAIYFTWPTFAQQQKSLKELIVGTWLLDSVYDQTQDGEKHNPWGDGVKGQAMFDAQGHYSWMIMSANRPKADTSPRVPVEQAIAYWGTYTVNDEAKTLTTTIERCTFPQWDGGGGTVSIAFPTEDEFQFTVTKPFPDPTLGPIAPHIIFKRATSAQQTNTVDPQLRQALLALAKKFEDAWNNNDATALAALFTDDAVLIEESGPVYGRDAIKKHYADLFQNVHFSDNHTTYNDPNSNSPHAIGTDGKEMWENGEWSTTWQAKGGDPVHAKGYHASIAVREDGVWKKRMVIVNTTPPPAAPAQTK